MAQPSIHVQRSFSGHHDLLPAAESGGTNTASFVNIHHLFIWTFGSGAVFWRIWPAVLLHTLFATAVTAISLRTKWDLSIPTVMLTVMGVVIGFVISYRASSAYDLYSVGRTAWSDLVKNTLTLTRLIWFHVPLRLTPKPPDGLAQPRAVASSPSREDIDTVMREKRMALDLLEGFAVSLKHHLRGERGIYYEDLYELVRPLHEHGYHSSADNIGSPSSSTAVDPQWYPRGASLSSQTDPLITAFGSISRTASDSTQYAPPQLLPASRDHSPSLLGRVSADLIPFVAHLRGIFSFYKSRMVSDAQPVGAVLRSRCGLRICAKNLRRQDGTDAGGDVGGIQRSWDTGVQKVGISARPRLARGDENIPVEILRRLSDWFATLEERGTVPGTSLGIMIPMIASLEDSLSVMDRIVTTPLPLVYAVHISTVWLYLFFLPFQLVPQFAWYTVPGVAIAAFIYLGFVAAGEEIEQPFGYDENDLDLDFICREIIRPDIARLKEMPGGNVFLGPPKVTPHDEQAQATADLLKM
ncbi:Bestrophin, RFP-TM, chloride channel-domain-containing protein [Lactifluus subvellereus]|nr:Bestrophin, RFP-TM, chloride channel-domain-containing protein [Lactifluus subvellereus]